MAVTTPGAIRTVLISLVTAATPDVHAADRFLAFREESASRFGEWVEANAAACLRRFSIRFRNDASIPDAVNGSQELVRQTFDAMVAYPTRSNRYTSTLGLDDVIASDLMILRSQAIGYLGFPAAYPLHASLCTVLSDGADIVEEGPVVTMATLPLRVEYWRSTL